MRRFDFDADGEMNEFAGGRWVRYTDHVEAMKRIAGAPVANALTAKQRYDEFMEPGEEPSAVERLRFFCSLAMSGQDWLDVEPFFDAILAAPPEQAAASPAALTDEQARQIADMCGCSSGMVFAVIESASALLAASPADQGEPSASPDALTDERVFELVGEVLGQPLIVEDLRQGFAVHTEPRDWLNFARALLAASPAKENDK